MVPSHYFANVDLVLDGRLPSPPSPGPIRQLQFWTAYLEYELSFVFPIGLSVHFGNEDTLLQPLKRVRAVRGGRSLVQGTGHKAPF